MTSSSVLIVVFLLLLACLPWLVNRLKRRYGIASMGLGHESRVMSVLAVGQQQKVVTVEVGPPDAKVLLVLGVTAQSVNCLHTMRQGVTGMGTP